ncbi:MAG: hypothetical protein KDB77_12885, partial [Flavobacteriales bacterium]|nr:hypothetical protein [Flavobacteriales bacterium]
MEYLSDRVSVDRGKGRTSVVISARLPKSRETLLVTWALAWTVAGAYMIWEVSRMPSGELRQYLLIFLAFWTYFEVKVLKAVAWRLKGFELWRIKDGTLTLKDSLWGF